MVESCSSSSEMAGLKESSLLLRTGGGAGVVRYLAIVRRPRWSCRAIFRTDHFSTQFRR
jgi:hypothetical protein